MNDIRFGKSSPVQLRFKNQRIGAGGLYLIVQLVIYRQLDGPSTVSATGLDFDRQRFPT